MKITERCSLEMVHISARQIYYKYSNVLQCLKMYSLWSLTPDLWSCQHEFKNQWKMFLPVSPARKSLNTWNLLVNFFSRVSLENNIFSYCRQILHLAQQNYRESLKKKLRKSRKYFFPTSDAVNWIQLQLKLIAILKVIFFLTSGDVRWSNRITVATCGADSWTT